MPCYGFAAQAFIVSRLKLGYVMRSYPLLSVKTVPVCSLWDGGQNTRLVRKNSSNSAEMEEYHPTLPIFSADAFMLPALAEPLCEITPTLNGLKSLEHSRSFVEENMELNELSLVEDELE